MDKVNQQYVFEGDLMKVPQLNFDICLPNVSNFDYNALLLTNQILLHCFFIERPNRFWNTSKKLFSCKRDGKS